MSKVGAASLPLHGGKAPRWLFDRMVLLAREITQVIVLEYGTEEFLTRISHPYWFQSLGCVLGFDWHSSGLTTTTTGALKLGIKGLEKDLGLWIAGGKGGTSRKTPGEIEKVGEDISPISDSVSNLIYASKMSAKVDSAGLQDGFQLYHHNFFFTKNGNWAVVQQGMNTTTRWARRYHWLSDELESFVNEPHKAIASQALVKPLNLIASSSSHTRLISTNLARTDPDKVLKDFNKVLERHSGKQSASRIDSGQARMTQPKDLPTNKPTNLINLSMPRHENIIESDIKPENLKKVLFKTYELQPKNFEALLFQPGVGPKTIRALALISELVYGAPASREDPVKYSFAHGGKDGTPFPVDKPTYDTSIEILKNAVNKAKIGEYEKIRAFHRLKNFL